MQTSKCGHKARYIPPEKTLVNFQAHPLKSPLLGLAFEVISFRLKRTVLQMRHGIELQKHIKQKKCHFHPQLPLEFFAGAVQSHRLKLVEDGALFPSEDHEDVVWHVEKQAQEKHQEVHSCGDFTEKTLD